MSIGLLIFLVYAIAIAEMHYRGKRRFPWSRQVLTHTNYLSPYNFFINRLSLLPNTPLHDSQKIDDLKLLKENWQVIRDEAVALAEEGDIKASEKLNDAGFNSFFRYGWTRFYLKWYDDYLPSAANKCPKTVELLKSTPNIKAAMFASLPPGGMLTPHRDPYPGALRYHLGLVTPNDDRCYIKVDEQIHSWRDGEDVLFDETFIHEAHNKTDEPRIIFFADVHRPLKFAWANKMSHWVSDKLLKASATQNEEGEQVGLINKVFEKVYGIRRISRRIKKWNEPVYKSLKYGLVALIIYAVLF